MTCEVDLEENKTHSKYNQIKKRIPSFHLEVSVKKWKDIEAEVLRINCAKEESETLKQLLSEASEKGFLQRGTFVPEGLHLIEGKEIVKNILVTHETLVQNTTGISLNGINSEEMTFHKKEGYKSLVDTIQAVEGIISLEKVPTKDYPGKWLLVVDRNRETEINKTLKKNLDSLYSSQTSTKRIVTLGK